MNRQARLSSTLLCRRAPIAASAGVLASVLIFAGTARGVPLPPLPGTAEGSAPGGTGNGSQDGAVVGGLEKVTRGVVTVERDGRILAVGTVLLGDGRVLTSLSALGGSDTADVRYADGTSVHAKVVHRDKAWDLALLVPLSGKWTDGLRASDVDPASADLRALVASHPGHAAIVPAHVRGTVEARAHDGTEELSNVLDVEIKGAPQLGAPITDPQGGVLGVMVRVCKTGPARTCTPLIAGAPVAAIREFLSHTPMNAVAPSPWLGIVGEPDAAGNTHGVRVMAVAPQSPADKGGLKANANRGQADLIVAVDGQPVDTPEKLAEFIGKHGIGENVKLLVLSGDKFRELAVILRPAP